MKYAFAVVAVAGLAAAANAQNTRFTTQVSLNGTSWSNAVSTSDADVFVRVLVSFVGTYPATATTQGLAGATFQPTLSNWSTANGDSRLAMTNEGTGAGVDGSNPNNTGRILPFASAGQGSGAASGLLTSFVDGGNTLRFAGSKNTTPTTNLAWGVIIGQTPRLLAPATYNTGISNVELFRYKVHVGAAGGATDRVLTATTPLNLIANGRGNWYQNDGGNPALQAPTLAEHIESATITVLVPTPGSLALLGLGGLVAARRRR